MSNCENSFHDSLFNGTFSQLEYGINTVLVYRATSNHLGGIPGLIKNSIVAPSKRLPKPSDPAVGTLLECIRGVYTTYQQAQQPNYALINAKMMLLELL